MPVRASRRIAGVLLTFAVFGFSWISPAAGQSVPTLTVTTSASYRPVIEEGRVEVAFDYTFENSTAATAFPGFFESIPVAAVDVSATTGSTDLLVGPTEESDDFATWLVAFGSPLEPGESVEVTLTWAIEGTPSLPGPIVEPGAVAFDVYVPGPDGAEWSAPSFDMPDGYLAVGRTTPEHPYEIVRAEFVNVALFTSSVAVLPPEVVVSDWEAGGGWTAGVVDRAEAVVGSLDNWFGPRTESFELRRAFASDNHAAVSDDVVELISDDAEAVDHQLAHAWLADVTVDEPWFLEGLAAAFAGDAANPSGAADIVPVIVNEIGVAGVRQIVDALRANAITYPGVVAEVQPLPPDWRTLLDHFEGAAGAEGVDDLFREAVIDPVDAPMLDRRAAVRTDYDALVFRAGGWTLPPYIRMAMASWEFDSFAAAQGEVSDVIVRRDALYGWEASLELTARDDAKAIFEAANDDMVEVNALLDEQEAALEAFDEAERLVNGDRGLLAGIGLFGHDADADLEGLREAWADGDYQRVEHDGHELASLVEGAVGAGTIRLLVPSLVLVALWQFVRLVRRRIAGPAEVARRDG